MENTRIDMYFSSEQEIALYKVTSRMPCLERLATAHRVKTSTRQFQAFKWTTASHALAVLCLRVACRASDPAEDFSTAVMVGGKGSMASAILFSLYRDKSCLRDIFGVDKNGRSVLARALRFANIRIAFGAPTEIFLNTALVGGSTFHVHLDGQEITNPLLLSKMCQKLEQSWLPRPKAPALDRVKTQHVSEEIQALAA